MDLRAATVERARALGAELFAERRGPGELHIPAIRGIGGGVIYFIDAKSELSRVWDIEFETTDVDATPAAGLTRIDHVAQTMNYEEMLSWVLFYTSIFKAGKLPMVDVVDPGGLVRSQVIENEAGTLRLTLNGAENRKSLAGRFVAESFGSAVQHLALGTYDIFAAATAMRDLGFEPLHISGNYYDDLEARLGVEPGLVERLGALNILYDRDDAGGEYFQFYSHIHGDGFFFEIVERRGGYSGYGAPNASFRIAAQKRELPPRGMPRN
jgi:4-hydroxyphenylpyruvate dioxygenase